MISVLTFASLCLLLVFGKILRVQIPILQRLYLPSSVIGGVIGLILFTSCGAAFPPELKATMAKCPGFLINVIFATIFLGAAVPRAAEIVRFALPQLTLGQILAWGQYVVGLGLAGFVFSRFFDVPAAFGNLLELGFEGGHGTVGGMTDSFIAFGWEDGIALGFTIATIGMIVGIVFGMAMIQYAHKKGIVKQVRAFKDRTVNERRGVHKRDKRPSAGLQTVYCDSIDSLAWHLAIVGLAMLIGFVLHCCIPMKGFPLFPLCMIGGCASFAVCEGGESRSARGSRADGARFGRGAGFSRRLRRRDDSAGGRRRALATARHPLCGRCALERLVHLLHCAAHLPQGVVRARDCRIRPGDGRDGDWADALANSRSREQDAGGDELRL